MVGEAKTAFHSLRVRVSAEQGRMGTLKKGDYLKETKQTSQSDPPQGEETRVGPEGRDSGFEFS